MYMPINSVRLLNAMCPNSNLWCLNCMDWLYIVWQVLGVPWDFRQSQPHAGFFMGLPEKCTTSCFMFCAYDVQ